jgi:transcriptional regulator with XRE-family HTH domain
MPEPRPTGYTDGLGGYVLARRLYTGLSQFGFALRCGMKRQTSISDIETGRRRTPAGFLDTVDAVVETFDADVETCIKTAEGMLVHEDSDVVHIEIGDSARDEYRRAVLCRASVESGLILPIIVCSKATERAG